MSPQDLNSSENNLPEWFDPFPEPHTMPCGWNLDSLMPSPNLQAVQQTDDLLKEPILFTLDVH